MNASPGRAGRHRQDDAHDEGDPELDHERVTKAQGLDGATGQRGDEEVADLLREVEPDGTTRGDREEAAEQARPQLAEMVEQRHHRLVAGCGGRRGRFRRQRDAGQPGFAQCVGVGHAVLRRVTPGLVRAGCRFAGRHGRRRCGGIDRGRGGDRRGDGGGGRLGDGEPGCGRGRRWQW